MPVWMVQRLRAQSGANYEFHLEHMEQPFDMFYSIAFERFELGSSRIRAVFESGLTCSNQFKNMSSDISFDTVFDTGRIRLEPSSKHKQITNPDGGVVKPNRQYYSIAFERFESKLQLQI